MIQKKMRGLSQRQILFINIMNIHDDDSMLFRSDLEESIDYCLNNFITPEEKVAITMYFGIDTKICTYKQIAARLDLTGYDGGYEKARNLITKVLHKLRQPTSYKILRDGITKSL